MISIAFFKSEKQTDRQRKIYFDVREKKRGMGEEKRSKE